MGERREQERREHRWTPGEQLPDGRWTPGTVVKTPAGHLARVLPYDTEFPNQSRSDEVFVQPLHWPEQPWQLLSSGDLTSIADEPQRPITAARRISPTTKTV